MTNRPRRPRRAPRYTRLQRVLVFVLCVASTGCYSRMSWRPSHHQVVSVSPAKKVKWGRVHGVQGKREGKRTVYRSVSQQQCRTYKPATIKLVTKGTRYKKSSRSFTRFLPLTLGPSVGLLTYGLVGSGDTTPQLAIGGAIIGTTLLAIAIRAALPRTLNSYRNRTIRGYVIDKKTHPCGPIVPTRKRLNVSVRGRGGSVTYRPYGKFVVDDNRLKEWKAWAAGCRAGQFKLQMKPELRARGTPRIGYSDRYRRYRLGRNGVRSGSPPTRYAAHVSKVLRSSGAFKIPPIAGKDVKPPPSGPVAKLIRRCTVNRERRIRKRVYAADRSCLQSFSKEFERECMEDCRLAGDATQCQWQREDCQLVAAGTAVNCATIYNRCMRAQGLTPGQLRSCAARCVRKISTKTCAHKRKMTEQAARNREALR